MNNKLSCFSSKPLLLFAFLSSIAVFPFSFVNAQCASANAAYIVDVVPANDGTCTFSIDVYYDDGAGNSGLSVTIETIGGTVLVDNDCNKKIKKPGSKSYGPFTGIDCSEELIVSWEGHTNPFCGGHICNTGTITISAISLPVELIDFTVKEKDDRILLDWITATEEGNAYFGVEHSMNSTDFFEIGIVEGAGTTDITQNYRFVHDRPSRGNNYYRLRQVDVGEQTFEYSETIVIKLEEPLKKILVYPTRTSDLVHIDFSEYLEETVEISLIALSGNVLQREVFSGGNYLYTVDMSPWPVGLYHLRMYFVERNMLSTRKIIKV